MTSLLSSMYQMLMLSAMFLVDLMQDNLFACHILSLIIIITTDHKFR